MISFSGVGLNAARTQGLVWIQHWCGVLCGGEDFFVVEKKNGVWTVATTDAGITMY